ncbi:transcription elongation factor GreA [Helcobacillus massiliensis]|uniref:Transcription elongation factor GreA n=1 Tax=Helcobacillus massiliensis TaxID=521392 RepID=A0A839QZP9_9MICO|nr:MULTISPECIES: transcription elongation factor GreA [Helcobacillus]MBB3022877.1 transcription elongation factor GreA [Helcobacillus massiliensis]MCG7426274.1 transcription elongation factor GreA [Helcobacillus sp. ACRRO]MCT1558140.1 transcription elongation factor GreA [Helcobacillus massiliensis]MCT2036505.1 transcription elongation factor GreA [Helcobacillus massiliensis]MCT2332309.1 transcription elongation factor GreA [Helcobacillus massiliensis]
MSENQQGAWLTQDAFDRLEAELAELEGPRRSEIVERISAARDEGDLKENGGYHAAREELGKLEGRIEELTHLLKTAVVGETPKDDGVVEPGMVVTVEMAGKERTFLLGNREIADDDETLEVFSSESPLGQAISGSSVGQKIDYTAPNGKSIPVTIVRCSPYDPKRAK